MGVSATRIAGPEVRRPTASSVRAATAPTYIPELHGLRGLALALVVAFHLFGNGRVSGGVDVFLVISGFLATGTLVRRSESGRLRITEYYGRTFSRLVPAALVVLSATAALAYFVLPSGTLLQTGREVLASATYWVNWEMIAGQLAYGAAGPQTSPLQHFWSMSVQGQFFVLWPLLVVLLAMLARRMGRRPTQLVLPFVIVSTAASFVFAAVLSVTDQQVAYFHSGARFWELGAGAILALLLPSLRVPDGLRPVLAWAGLVLVVTCGFVLDGGTVFPGPWALWPVLGTYLVLLGSGGSVAYGPRRLLETRPLRFVADISYALYLWHWPLLIVYLNHTSATRLDWRGALLVLSASVVLSWGTERLMSRPVQRFRDRRGPAPALVAMVTAVALFGGSAFAGVVVLERKAAAADARTDALVEAALRGEGGQRTYDGALAMQPGFVAHDYDEPLLPSTTDAENDRPDTPGSPYDDCVQGFKTGTDAKTCVLSDPPDATRTVVVVGDSHALQWGPALERVGTFQGWNMLMMAKLSCRLRIGTVAPTANESCVRWNADVLPALLELRPDAVIVVGTRTSAIEPETVATEEVAAWQRLHDAGIPVITLRDSPRFQQAVPECLEKQPDGAECGAPREEVYPPASPLTGAPGVPEGTVHIDLSDIFCTADRCPAVIGNVLVYRDDDHITATFAATAAPILIHRLRESATFLAAGVG